MHISLLSNQIAKMIRRDTMVMCAQETSNTATATRILKTRLQPHAKKLANFVQVENIQHLSHIIYYSTIF